MRCSLRKITLSSAPAGWGAACTASHSQTLCRGTHRVPSLTLVRLTVGTGDCSRTWKVLTIKHENITCAMLTHGSEFITFKDSGIQELVEFYLKALNSLVNTFPSIWFCGLSIMKRAPPLWSPMTCFVL